MPETYHMSEPDVQRIAKETAKEVLREMGFDASEAREIYADSLYLRKQRLGAEQFQGWVKRGAVGVFISAVAFAIWQGVVAIINKS